MLSIAGHFLAGAGLGLLGMALLFWRPHSAAQEHQQLLTNLGLPAETAVIVCKEKNLQICMDRAFARRCGGSGTYRVINQPEEIIEGKPVTHQSFECITRPM